MVGWLRRLIPWRSETPAPPLSPRQQAILARTVRCYPRIGTDGQQRLCALTAAFLARTEFVAHEGVSLTDEMRVCIAGNACVLLLGLPHLGTYPNLREVIVHRGEFGRTVEAIGPDGRRYHIRDAKCGEAHHRGPVVLSWEEVKRSVADPHDGYHVVFHEFAHVLDGLDGVFQGLPPLSSAEQYRQWFAVMNEEFEAFRGEQLRGRRTFLDPYAAESPAEFFAVVTEHFFEQPRELAHRHPRLYAQLKAFYRQDPAAWGPAAPSGEA